MEKRRCKCMLAYTAALKKNLRKPVNDMNERDYIKVCLKLLTERGERK